jgi:gluconokinase
MKPDLVLALDIGTSSVRAMLFDSSADVVGGIDQQIPYSNATSQDGGVEVDADMLVALTVNCVRQVLRQTSVELLHRVHAVGVSCFWHSLVGVDDSNKAVTPVFSWADTRSRGQAAELKSTEDEGEYHRRTGCVFHPSYWPSKLLWLRESRSDVFKKARRWMSFVEYLELRLFGDSHASISMVSGTGLYNPNLLDWDEDALDIAQIDREQLNPVVDRTFAAQKMVDKFTEDLGAFAMIPWFAAVGDGACSNIGSGASRQPRIAINAGTSGAMRVGVQAQRVDIPDGLFCYRIDSGSFLLGGAISCCGNAYAWLTQALDNQSNLSGAELGAMPPDSHGLTVLPFWAGERSPGWHSNATATITGMNLHTTPTDIVLATMESVAYTFADILDRIQAPFPDATEIIASGGVLQAFPEWGQIMADVFGCRVSLSKIAEASSRGAAVVALAGLGIIGSLADTSVAMGQTFAPDPTRHAIYRQALNRYRNLYAALLEG